MSGEDPSTDELLRSLPGAPDPSPPLRPAPGASTGPVEGPFTIQIGAFGSLTAADRRAAEGRSLAPRLSVEVDRAGALWRVFLGRFGSRAEAETALSSLAARGLGPAWVTGLPRP